MAENELKGDLRELVRKRQVVVVVGSGVSMSTNAQSPTWRGLLESGVERCRMLGAEEAWCGQVKGSIAMERFPDMLLSAAELVHARLVGFGQGEFARWLREHFEALKPVDGSVIKALGRLDAPLVTTNYDSLIEQVCGLGPVDWMNARVVSRVVRGEDRRVLHLHGHWDNPDSVVLGIRSYEAVKNNEHTQAVMRAFALSRSLLFVGCGEEGLGDPNFGNFLSWLERIETTAMVEHRHYRLVRESDGVKPSGRVFPLIYGAAYEDLAGFLAGLTDSGTATGRRPAASVGSPVRALPENITHYLKLLEARNAYLSLIGLGRSLQIELPIAEAYVPLQATLTRMPKRHEKFEEFHGEFDRNVDLDEVFQRSAELGLKGVVLLGEPGSGKTTGARQLAWRLASRQSRGEDLGLPPGITPVFLRFRNITKEALAKKDGLRVFLEEETECPEAGDGLGSPGAELWNGKGGGLLWILDGLDEVSDPEARATVSGWIRKAIENRPDDWFLVTCRFQGYSRQDVHLGPKFAEFHVRPLDQAQIQRFVSDWFGAAYARLLGKGGSARARAEAESGELLEILAQPDHKTGHMRELCANPLMLTILCVVFNEERQLPTGRAELYAHCVRVLLQYWRHDRYAGELGKQLDAYDAEAAQSVLARVAWWMHQEQDQTEAPLGKLAEEAEKGLAEVSPESGLGRDGKAFLERMREETGILAMAGGGQWGFLHLSFQEYLAAEHAAREGYAKELTSWMTESWWREVALLSLRRSRPYCESFFEGMIANGIVEHHPELAERCLTEALYFSVDPFMKALRQARPKGGEGQAAHDKRVAAILRLFLDRTDRVPELVETVRGLAGSSDRATSDFAHEFLVRGRHLSRSEVLESDVRVEERSGISFVRIPEGEFRMGSEGKGFPRERPVHPVRLTQGFELGKYPVTNAQYARYLEATRGAREPEYWGNRRFNQPEQPVVGVSWEEAVSFCKWAGCRLPTEAEWEYACRAGTRTEFSFGDDEGMLGEYGWFDRNSGGQTQPVGSKKPNGWGLHDMHGNVWEWCQDWFGDDYYGQSPEVDPPGPGQGPYRVLRGGGWDFSAEGCRSAFRRRLTPWFWINFLGFRVARSSVH